MFFVSKRGFFNTKPIFFEEFADEKTKEKDKEKPYKIEEGGKIRVVHQNIVVDVVLSVQGQSEECRVKNHIKNEHRDGNPRNDGGTDSTVLPLHLRLPASDEIDAEQRKREVSNIIKKEVGVEGVADRCKIEAVYDSRHKHSNREERNQKLKVFFDALGQKK